MTTKFAKRMREWTRAVENPRRGRFIIPPGTGLGRSVPVDNPGRVDNPGSAGIGAPRPNFGGPYRNFRSKIEFRRVEIYRAVPVGNRGFRGRPGVDRSEIRGIFRLSPGGRGNRNRGRTPGPEPVGITDRNRNTDRGKPGDRNKK